MKIRRTISAHVELSVEEEYSEKVKVKAYTRIRNGKEEKVKSHCRRH